MSIPDNLAMLFPTRHKSHPGDFASCIDLKGEIKFSLTL